MEKINKEDLIRRSDAIDAAIEAAYKWDGCYSVERARIIADDLKALSSAEPEPDKRLEKIADLVDGTIDHFDRDDAMDLLYQIKEVLNER